MISRDCGQITILALFTLLGIAMLITNQPHAWEVYMTFQSGLFLRMQLKGDPKPADPVKKENA